MDVLLVQNQETRQLAVDELEVPLASESQTVLSRLLQMADVYRRQQSPKQAIEMYFQLVESHGQTPEGQQARERLMRVAAEYEAQGLLRQARSIYEQLL
jgi:lipopolysaccharide biosynthesis regulator YciM